MVTERTRNLPSRSASPLPGPTAVTPSASPPSPFPKAGAQPQPSHRAMTRGSKWYQETWVSEAWETKRVFLTLDCLVGSRAFHRADKMRGNGSRLGQAPQLTRGVSAGRFGPTRAGKVKPAPSSAGGALRLCGPVRPGNLTISMPLHHQRYGKLRCLPAVR